LTRLSTYYFFLLLLAGLCVSALAATVLLDLEDFLLVKILEAIFPTLFEVTSFFFAIFIPPPSFINFILFSLCLCFRFGTMIPDQYE